jgi:hypothetical protein
MPLGAGARHFSMLFLSIHDFLVSFIINEINSLHLMKQPEVIKINHLDIYSKNKRPSVVFTNQMVLQKQISSFFVLPRGNS